MQYSIVIPAHNEASNLETQVTSFIENLPNAVAEVLKEIIIVENGSTDGTLNVSRQIERKFPNLVKVITIPKGSYGEAIKTGMLTSVGTHLSILECDFLDSAFVVKSIALFLENARFIVGSKRHVESNDRRPFKRRALTALYNLIFLRIFIGYPGTDTHGLKSMESECAKELCRKAVTTDEVFQTEIVLLAWRLGFEIDEIPVHIHEIRTAPVSILHRAPKVLNTVRELRKSLKRFPPHNPSRSLRVGLTSSCAQQKDLQAASDENRRPLQKNGLPRVT